MSDTGGRVVVYSNPNDIYVNDLPVLRLEIEYRTKDAVLELLASPPTKAARQEREEFLREHLREFCTSVLTALDMDKVEWHFTQ